MNTRSHLSALPPAATEAPSSDRTLAACAQRARRSHRSGRADLIPPLRRLLGREGADAHRAAKPHAPERWYRRGPPWRRHGERVAAGPHAPGNSAVLRPSSAACVRGFILSPPSPRPTAGAGQHPMHQGAAPGFGSSGGAAGRIFGKSPCTRKPPPYPTAGLTVAEDRAVSRAEAEAPAPWKQAIGWAKAHTPVADGGREQRRGWPAGACPRSGLRPDLGAGYDGKEGASDAAPAAACGVSLATPPRPHATERSGGAKPAAAALSQPWQNLMHQSRAVLMAGSQAGRVPRTQGRDRPVTPLRP